MKNILSLAFSLLLLVPVFSQTQIRLQKNGGVYFIPCKVNGLELRFIFDTGATDVAISLAELVYMIRNGHMDKNDIKGTEYYRIANGEIEEGIVVNIRSMEIGGVVINNVSASVSKSLNAPLLLGNSALSKFGRFSFDYANNLLLLGNTDYTDDFSTPKNYPEQNLKSDFHNGNGIYKYPNGEYYEGGWRDNKRNGFGVMTFPSISKYEGEWNDDKRNGIGTKNFTNGVKLTGEWKNDKLNGFGAIIYSEVEKYEGEFKDGKPNGFGLFYFKDGKILNGYWRNGEFLYSN